MEWFLSGALLGALIAIVWELRDQRRWLRAFVQSLADVLLRLNDIENLLKERERND